MNSSLDHANEFMPSIYAAPVFKTLLCARKELLSPRQKAEIKKHSKLTRIDQGVVVYEEGEEASYVWNIAQGLIETYHLLPQGTRRITSFLFPGDLLGLMENGFYVSTARTVQPVVAFQIPIQVLSELALSDSQLSAALLTKLCQDLREAQRHIICISQKDAAPRLATFILWLCTIYGNDVEPPKELSLPLARHQIAEYLGLTTESVSRAFHLLESSKAIMRRTPRLISILDMEKLRGFSTLEVGSGILS
ncbi:Crp/Fnr family transcriptional regulator [Halotalea alkalilenta]|uniref:HTH crp-type domain-containing protein n=1 Tax=Halotalea alkalilenta TaxID=376489 RepID=A0A172YD68_9GAMM|nr:Crp/Fnr family transcriptional regulator [Halotalea alkalilenta]ANF57199.1 hypothetical protein A5892_06745 [Halotalea alkalilenta]